ncbi:MAG TPA: hypothetical protein VHS81_14665, partial [Caulobacteraceae bacterium]|nr:hypothetical protein [Caulobacteraceae bacterium]
MRMLRLAALAASFACLVGVGMTRAQTAAGDWMGTLVAGPAQSFHLGVHIKKTDAGLAGTLDDTSRGIGGFALSDVSLTGDTLSFKVPIAGAPGTYTAKWDAAARAWVGTWTQSGQGFPLTLAPGVQPPLPTVAGLDGAWDGVLALGQNQLHLTLHVKTTAVGTAAWMDSIDQLAYGLDVQGLKRSGEAIGFDQPALKAAFSGKLAANGQSIAGQYT